MVQVAEGTGGTGEHSHTRAALSSVDFTPWDVSTEKLVSRWKVKASYLVLMHEAAARYYAWVDACLSMPNTFMIGLLSTSLFASGTFPEILGNGFVFGCGTVAALSTALAAVHQALQHARRAQKHLQAAVHYKALADAMEEELAYARTQREDSKTFNARCRQSRDTIEKTAPIIPEHIKRKYVARLEHKLNEGEDVVTNVHSPTATPPPSHTPAPTPPAVGEAVRRGTIQPQSVGSPPSPRARPLSTFPRRSQLPLPAPSPSPSPQTRPSSTSPYRSQLQTSPPCPSPSTLVKIELNNCGDDGMQNLSSFTSSTPETDDVWGVEPARVAGRTFDRSGFAEEAQREMNRAPRSPRGSMSPTLHDMQKLFEPNPRGKKECIAMTKFT